MKLKKYSKEKELVKRINKMAVPILLSYLSHIIYSIGDQGIIGRTNIGDYAAVSLVSQLLFAITGTLGIITLSLNIIGSKKIGAKDLNGYSEFFSTVLTIAITIGISFEFLCIIFGRYILQHFFHMESRVLESGYIYLSVAGLGLGLNMIIFVFSSYFRTVEKTKIILISTIISSIINITIDYILVFGKLGFPKLGVLGAAIGTVVGLTINVIIYVVGFRIASDFKYGYKIKLFFLKQLFKSYVPLLGQDFVESTGFTIFITIIISKLGVSNIAIYGLILTLMQLVTLPVYAYCNVSMIVVAKANGAGDFELIEKLPIILAKILIPSISFIGFIMILFKSSIGKVITNDNSLVIGVSKVILIALLSQFLNITNQIYKFILNALEDEKWVLYYSALVSIVSAILIYILAVKYFNIYGIYIGIGIGFIINSVGLFFRYKKVIKIKNNKLNLNV